MECKQCKSTFSGGMYGKLVLYKQSVNSGEAINVTALPTGTCFVKIYGNKKPLGSLKMLKVN
jgi:hypothetical protein